ncbi:MAG: hypothetical protein ACR2OZ_11175 [Verrucomicrobiales bacterium]
MNYRRALRASTNTGLAIFLFTIVGVVLWTTDEVLNWNILPDWIDKYAQVLVIVLAILAAFSVVISVMCSFAVLAESAAEKAGMAAPASSRRTRGLIVLSMAIAFGIMFGLHKVDQFRSRKNQEAEEQKKTSRYAEVEKELQSRIPNVIALFSPGLRQHLAGTGTAEGDALLARLFDAIHSSTPFAPEVTVLVPADAPYRFCMIKTADEPREAKAENQGKPLDRRFLTDLPTKWEIDAIQAMFRLEAAPLPKESHGVFIDTRKPSAWGAVVHDDKAVAVVMLRGEKF